jgi:hypothetical protein
MAAADPAIPAPMTATDGPAAGFDAAFTVGLSQAVNAAAAAPVMTVRRSGLGEIVM